MKKLFASIVALAAATPPLLGQFTITSFDHGGLLTWTNSVSNAIYSLQWKGSLTDSWRSFGDASNLNRIAATNYQVSATAPFSNSPVFYRVVWTNAPLYAGLYDMSEYDLLGNLVVTGQVWIAAAQESDSFQGWRNLYLTGSPTNSDDSGVYGPQIGPGGLAGTFTDPAIPRISMNFNPELFDNNVYLGGILVGNTVLGHWGAYGISSRPFVEGTFTALRRDAPPPHPAAPGGSWHYEATGLGGSVTGQLTITADTNSFAGAWSFELSDSSSTTQHLLGAGVFTNAVVSGNSLSITIPSQAGAFTIEGEMVEDVFAGFWTPPGTNRWNKGEFLATRNKSGKD